VVRDLLCLLHSAHSPSIQVAGRLLLHTPQELLVEKAFIEMDSDADGRVTEAEFVRACQAHREFTKMLTLSLIDVFTV
jgi:hypothetical protein